MPLPVLADFAREIRLSARGLARTPAWTLSLVLTIALGIASNASVDGFVRGLLNPGPSVRGDAVSMFSDDGRRPAGPLSYDQVAAVRARVDLFRSVGAVRETQAEAWLGKPRLLVSAAMITPDVVELLQLPGGGGIVVSHRLWDDDFVGVSIDGQLMRINGADRPVTGVAPESLEGLYRGRAIDLWIVDETPPADRSIASYWAVGRWRDGVDRDGARLVLGGSTPPIAIRPYTGLLPEAADAMARIGRLLRIAAIAVFVIACANVASFLLSRAAARSRETAVRVAVGARRRQLIRQVLADSLLISMAGATLGAILAMWLSQIVPAFLFDQDARQMVFAGDPRSVAAVAIACALITTLCGLLPLIESRHDTPGAIIQRETSGPSRAAVRLGSGLVVVQMTACTLLVISAGLMLAGLRSALQTSAGRRLSHPILVSVEALQMSSKTQEMTSGLRYFAAAARAGQDVAGASNIAWIAPIPGNPPVWQSFEFERPDQPKRALELQSVPFTARSIDDVVLPPIEGRMFGNLDAGPCGGVIVSQQAARRLGAEHLVGRSIQSPAGEWSEIVGVVATRDETARVYHYAPDLEPAETRPSTAVYSFLEIPPSSPTVLDVNIVSPNYFDVIALPILAGRTFAGDPDACRVAVVNQEAADVYFNGEAVGGAMIDRQGRRTSVIGVVGSAALHAAQRRVAPAVYLPFTQDFQPRVSMIMETGGVDRATLRQLRARIAAIPGGREERIAITTLESQLSRTALAPARIATVLVGASAAIALLLGAMGLYGVMTDAARRRRREFALRIALGARGGHVVGQVIAEGMRLALAGTAAGTAGSLLVARWLSQVAPSGDGLSLFVWLVAPALLAVAVVVASVVPARAAASADPLMIMRDQ